MKLAIGTQVFWRGDCNDAGVVAGRDWVSVTIKWGRRSYQTILHNDMIDVSKEPLAGRL
jgi:hypothetical protein